MLINKIGSTTRLGGVYTRLESEKVIIILKYKYMIIIKEHKLKIKTAHSSCGGGNCCKSRK